MKIYVSNKKAHVNYHFLETYVAGIELKGTEVKSLCKSDASLDEAFIIIKNGQAFILNMHIAPFKEGNIFNVDSRRTRKLLLNKAEIVKINAVVKKDGLALIPLNICSFKNKLKVTFAISKSKNKKDKREDIKKRDDERNIKKYY